MYAVLDFLGVTVVLYSLRLYLLRRFKRDAAVLPSANENLYEANQKLVNTEMYFVFLLLTGCIIAALMMESWEEEYELISNVLTAVFIGIILISAFNSSRIMQRSRSFFCWNTEYIEFNLAFANPHKKTIKIFLDKIENIIAVEKEFIIKMKDGKDINIRKNLITLLNNHENLMSKLENFEVN